MHKFNFGGDVWLVVRDENSALIINPPDLHPDLMGPVIREAQRLGFTHQVQGWVEVDEDFDFPIGLDVTYLQKQLTAEVGSDLEGLVEYANEGC